MKDRLFKIWQTAKKNRHPGQLPKLRKLIRELIYGDKQMGLFREGGDFNGVKWE